MNGARLEAVLASSLGVERVEVTAIDKVTGGYSRIMHRVTARIDGEERRLVWRADPSPEQEIVRTDRAREFSLLAALGGAAGAPKAHYFDADGSELGAVSMLVDYVEGEQLLVVLKATPEDRWQRHVRGVADLAARIHGVDLELLTEALPAPPDWTAHIDACIAEWRALAEGQVEPAPLVRYVAEWLDRNRPPEVPLTLLHGDLQTPNVIVDGDRFSAIDWEFARIGDPREDLGYFAAMAAITPPDPIAGDLSVLCEAYREHAGLSEAQINPAAVAYFSMLPFGPMVRQFVGQVSELVAGRNRSLKTANLALVVTAMVEGWIGLIHQLDAAELEAPAR